ncbi:uncharacterized protein F4812DRAFT_451790 [Daldinia caldariorum]|uniref:uncharacterized protein n=1 Tax=Daldinia caldariorum TaxID=326644 RepID=UPI002008216E|nr:uncharacterized protein F4812DRAFT_451790 [Daldinia caldariorum]KAI1466937.1 hypothetical protein F4812DRAFT_451790 [Daldinia caldariorum]
MEHMLRCNNLKCRKELGDRALVTTCSHIFCTDCAARLGLTSQRHEHRNSCPACNTPLTNPDDAVISNLNPSEDYKTSVLSGLSPYVIIECASRALSFWAYQATQEVFYHEKLGATLTEKYSNLNVHLDKVINDANLEISRLEGKLSGMAMEHESLRRKNDELAQGYKEKNRKLLQIQELYDKLKQRAMLGQMQDAAEDAVDSALHGPSLDRSQVEDSSRNLPDFQEHGMSYAHQRPALHEQERISAPYHHQGLRQNYNSSWPGTVGVQQNIPVTPSTHRQRLGETPGIGLATIPGLVSGTPQAHQANVSIRAQQHAIPSSNLQSGIRFPAVGLSSGLKVSHDGSNSSGGLSASLARPRAVAQRPTPLSSTFHRGQASDQPQATFSGLRSSFANL